MKLKDLPKSRVLYLTLAFLIGLVIIYQYLNKSELSKHRPNIIFIVIDTLAAKYVDGFGGAEGLTPNLGRLAREGVVFKNAFSTAPWTRPAIASMLSGRLPADHGIERIKSRFRPNVKSIAEEFQTTGWRTSGFVSHILVSPKTSFRRGFDEYQMIPMDQHVHKVISSEWITNSAINWIKQNTSSQDKPFFLFLHYFDPHYLYRHHPDHAKSLWYKGSLDPDTPFKVLRNQAMKLGPDDRRFINDLYREEILYTDSYIGELISFLESSGSRDNTLVVIAADHGEEFFERGGIGHGRTMFNEVLHVPLLFWGPKYLKPSTIDTWVSIADIAPTLLSVGNLPVNKKIFGRSLQKYLNGSAPSRLEKERPLFAQVDHNANLNAVIRRPFKFIADQKTGEELLFDLEADPKEEENLLNKDAELSNEMRTFLNEMLKEGRDNDFQANDSVVDANEIDALKSLGYLN